MSNPSIKVSKPNQLDGVTRSEVFEFFPDHKKLGEGAERSIVFLHRGKTEAWKSEYQRDKIFQQLAQTEESLKQRTVVEILEVTESSFSYSYRKDGNLVRKNLALDPQAQAKNQSVSDQRPGHQTVDYQDLSQDEPVIGHQTIGFDALFEPAVEKAPMAQMCYKTQELSLRQFKQIELSSALIEGLQSVIDFFATPFVAFYRLVSGAEARSFAEMLNPVQHDRVGELKHEDVLSQLHFVGQFFASADTQQHEGGLGIEAESNQQISFQDTYRACREKLDAHGKTYYEVWAGNRDIPSNLWVGDLAHANKLRAPGKRARVENYDDSAKWKAVAKKENETLKPSKDGKGLVVCEWRQREVDLTQDELEAAPKPLYAWEEPKTTKTIFEIQHPGGGWEPTVEGSFDPGIGDTYVTREDVPEELNTPKCKSAVQKAAALFSEGSTLGREIHAARNSGSTKQIKEAALLLDARYKSLPTEKAMIVPVGQGEGRDYVPHFLVFVDVPEVWGRTSNLLTKKCVGEPVLISPRRVLMKHISFSSITLEKGNKIEAVTTYDVTTQLENSRKRMKFFNHLITHHPYSRNKDAQEVTLKGPMHRDLSFEKLLLEAGQVQVSEAGPRLSKASRDPVKALFTIIKELTVQENKSFIETNQRGYSSRGPGFMVDPTSASAAALGETFLAQVDSKLPEISASKAQFYKFYVDHLTSYYEENEGRLSPDERARALDGILHYAEKVRHYMQKELGVDAALAITEHFTGFVEKKLSEMKRTETLEKVDVGNLQNKANTFWAKLSAPIEETLTVKQTTNSIDGYRMRIDEAVHLVKMRTELANNRIMAAECDAPLIRFQDLMKRARQFLQDKDLLAAKTLLLEIMQALPPASPMDGGDRTVWDMISLGSIDLWSIELTNLAEAMFEATARSGTFPLRPHEIFDFNTVIPLIQRYLFQRKIASKVVEFNNKWEAYKTPPASVALQPLFPPTILARPEVQALLSTVYHLPLQTAWNNITGVISRLPPYESAAINLQALQISFSAYHKKAQVVNQLQARKAEFIDMRKGQIVKEVTERLEAKWNEDDAEERAEMAQYYAAEVAYPARVLAYEAAQLVDHRFYRLAPSRPVQPTYDDAAVKHEKRYGPNGILVREIKDAKRSDEFLNELKDLDVADMNWDALMNSAERMVAVMGCFAKIVGISQDLMAYKICGDGWISRTFQDNNRPADVWLIKKDRSVVVGSSPAFEKRYQACERALAKLHTVNPNAAGIKELAQALITGFEGRGDGTIISDKEESKALSEEIALHQQGYFNPGAGAAKLVPEEVAQCCKVIEMRKILGNCTKHLQPHSSGWGSAIQNRLMGEHLTGDTVRRKFAGMSSIRMVASVITSEMSGTTGCFTVSASDSPGLYATTNSKEKAPTHLERANFLGQASPEMCDRQVGGDTERQAYAEISRMQKSEDGKLFPDLDEVEAFVLSESALAQGINPEELSYLSISQCLHFIYQFPDKVAIPAVQHTLYKTFFQHGLIRDLLVKNPQFLIVQGTVLHEICFYLQSRPDHLKSEIFLREVCERIRRHAKDLQTAGALSAEIVQQISNALPAYNRKFIAEACLRKMDPKEPEQKEFAQFALSYYCHQFDDDPEAFAAATSENVGLWAEALNVFYITQKSPTEQGHSGWQAELIHTFQSKVLPMICNAINESKPPHDADAIRECQALRNQLLNLLSGQEGSWFRVKNKDYAYVRKVADKEYSEPDIDLRTGKGFELKIADGERCKLPQQIRNDEDNFRFLFKQWNPTVLSKTGINDVTGYLWTDETGTVQYEFRYFKDRSFQIFQTVLGQTYRFQRLGLSEAASTKLWQLFARHNNSTIEDLVKTKGVWIPVDAAGQADLTRVLVAQYDSSVAVSQTKSEAKPVNPAEEEAADEKELVMLPSLDKDPITLRIKGDKIVEATVGQGEEALKVCSGLAQKDGTLMSCRDGNGLLLLSKGGTYIDEIRFPVDKETKEQLILKKSDKHPEKWVVSGREDWEWQLANTQRYESRFGKNWRQYILPLRNSRPIRTNSQTGQPEYEEEFWIFPHLVTGGEKKGEDPIFLRSAVDFIDAAGGKLSEMGLPEGVDFEDIRMVAGAAENFAGGAANLVDAAGAMVNLMPGADAPDGFDGLIGLLKSIAAPRGIRYRIEGRTESSSHAGFFYLAFVASKRGDWGTASRYLKLMGDAGHSKGPEDIKQLRKMALFLLGIDSLKGDMKDLVKARSPMEAAFRAKLAAGLIVLHTTMKAQHGIELLSAEDLPVEVPEGMRVPELTEIIQMGGVQFYMQYRQGLSSPQHLRQLTESGLLLTQREEAILTDNPLAFAASIAVVEGLENLGGPENRVTASPFQLEIPDPQGQKVTKMIETMSSLTDSTGVWSIHDMHQQSGTYPKWETILAHFWDYWDWIHREELSVEDVSFLIRDIPPNAKYRDEVDTARRFLLMRWHYKFTMHHLQPNDPTRPMETEVTEIQKIRLNMTDMAAFHMKSATLKQEASMSPGILRVGYAKAYEYMVDNLKKYTDMTYHENVGGVEYERGAKHEFKQYSHRVLVDFLGTAMEGLRITGNVLTIGSITEPVDYDPPQPIKTVDPRQKHLDHAVKSLLNAIPQPLREVIGGDQFTDMIKPLFDLPFSIAQKMLRDAVAMLISQAPPEAAQQMDTPLRKSLINSYINTTFGSIHNQYARNVGMPETAYPKHVPEGLYEKVEVRLPDQRPNWSTYFGNTCRRWNTVDQTWVIKESPWDLRSKVAKEKFNPESIPKENIRERHKFQKICDGIDEACEDLKKRTGSSFDVTKLKEVHREISLRLKSLKADEKRGLGAVIDFARSHGPELGILHLFADRKRFTDGQIFDHMLDLYRYGQLGRLEDPQLQVYLAELITETILIATERQQYEKALATCRDLSVVLKEVVAGVPRGVDVQTRKNMVQSRANQDVDWILYSTELKRFLDEGSNRLRYTITEDGIHSLKDQRFTRRYLVSDYRNQWTSRQKAISALEQMMNDLHTKKDEQGKPVRFIRAKMGTGKSDFVFPEAIDLLTQRGRQPIMITTDDLVRQLDESMGHKAFVFNFDIYFGLKEKASQQEIEAHLKTVVNTLHNLQSEGKAVLTSPSQIGGLRDKRVHLQDLMRQKAPGPERSLLFQQLQLVKQIEAHFKLDTACYLVDEDVNFDNSYEYNFATGAFRNVNEIRFDVAEQIIHLISAKDEDGRMKHPELWDKIVNNNLRSIQDVEGEFRVVAQEMFRDTEFWTSVGWNAEAWSAINEKQFVDFVLGLRPELPDGMELWNPRLKEEDQREKAYVAALKTYLSATLASVRGANPRLERGISAHNGVTVVPYSDGEEKKGILYGEESETILHHAFHYLGARNQTGDKAHIGEQIFLDKEKELGGLDLTISPRRPETWRSWAGRIATVRNEKGYGSKYEAFTQDPELALERFQFLRYLMLSTPEVKVYLEQITFNSQDLGIGTDVRVGSGTGQPFALNLADYTDDGTQDADSVLGETLLCMDLTKPTKTFKPRLDENGKMRPGTPLEHIQEQAAKKHCHAIMNFDYDVLGGDCERVAQIVRQEGRQAIYRDKNLEKKIWGPHQFFAMGYEPGAIDQEALFYYSRRDARGVHFHVPRGGNHYGDAMIGTGNKEDAIAQLVWRLRHLDMGHRVRFSHDEKTEAQIRIACKIAPGEPVTAGDAMRYFTLNALEEEDVKNVKGVIFKAQTPAKTHLDASVRAPYNLEGINDSVCLEELELAVFEATRGLYILSSNINWLHEYQPQKTANPIQFMQQLYEDELGKLVQRSDEFRKGLELVKQQPQARLVSEQKLILNWLETQYTGVVAYMTPGGIAIRGAARVKQDALKAQHEKELQELEASEETKVKKEALRAKLVEKFAVDARAVTYQMHCDLSVMGWNERTVFDQATFKTNLEKELAKFKKSYTPEEIAIAREILLKTHALRQGFEKTARAIRIEQNCINKDEYKKFLLQNLPAKITVDLEGGARNEQRVQQLQQQERKQEQKKLERVTSPTSYDEASRSIDFGHFKQVVLGKKPIVATNVSSSLSSKTKQEHNFGNNGYFLPVSVVFREKLGQKPAFLPEDLYQDVYISERAWRMLYVTGVNGAPTVEVMVATVDNRCHTVIVTPTEREEVLADAFIQERRVAALQADPLNVRPPPGDPLGPPYTEDQAWNQMKIEFAKLVNNGGQMGLMGMLAAALNGDVGAKMEEKRRQLLPYLQGLLAQDSPQNAWQYLFNNITPILGIMGMEAHANTIRPRLGGLENPIKGIYQKYRAANPLAMKGALIDHLAVYALSNENFSYMCMDFGAKLPEQDPRFVHMMVMNKVCLDWCQFSLQEMDHLITLVDNLKNSEFNEFCYELLNARCPAIVGLLIDIHERVAVSLKPAEDANGENTGQTRWTMMGYIDRKLRENYPHYSKEEDATLKRWIKKASILDIAAKLNYLKLQKKDASVKKIEDLRKVIEEKRARAKERNQEDVRAPGHGKQISDFDEYMLTLYDT